MAEPVATLTVSGLADLESALLELGNAVAGQALYNALMQAAIPIQDTAIVMAPQAAKPHYRYKRRGKRISRRGGGQQAASQTVEKELIQPGNLRRNIVRRRLKGKKYASLTAGEAYVGVAWTGNAFYGRHMEFGTSTVAARPFLRPAFDARSAEALGIFMDRLRDNIERARRKASAAAQGANR